MTDLVPPTRMSQHTSLIDLLDLESVYVDMFSSRHTGEPGGRVFGGEISAQALVAAERTVLPGFTPHSLHAYYLRPGETGEPIVYHVERPHDGRSFQRRRVVALQYGQPILCMDASFTTVETSAAPQVSAPAAPRAEDCRPLRPLHAKGWTVDPAEAFDIRGAAPAGRTAPTGAYDMWFRLREDRTTDRVSPAAVLTYLSDYQLLTALLQAVPLRRAMLTSLDHSIWFHNTTRTDDWLYYAKSTPAAGPVHGLAEGRLFHRDGTLIATVVQEGLVHAPRSNP